MAVTTDSTLLVNEERQRKRQEMEPICLDKGFILIMVTVVLGMSIFLMTMLYFDIVRNSFKHAFIICVFGFATALSALATFIYFSIQGCGSSNASERRPFASMTREPADSSEAPLPPYGSLRRYPDVSPQPREITEPTWIAADDLTEIACPKTYESRYLREEEIPHTHKR